MNVRHYGLLFGVSFFLLAGFKADGEPAYESTQDVLLDQADQFERAGQFQDAIARYEQLVLQGAGRDPHWTAYVLFRMACAQLQAGDRMGSQESVGTAITLDPGEPSYQAFQADLSGRRYRPSLYRADRDKGSARRLISTNGVLHIFVRGRNTDAWEKEESAATQEEIETADHWLQARAAESSVHQAPVFSHRYLSLPDEPFWRRIDVPDAETSRKYRAAWVQAVLLRFQAASLSELFDREFEGLPVDNRSVVFHAAKRDDTFMLPASPRREENDLENAVVIAEKSDRVNFYEGVSYARALLRLYGADLLCNKEPDPSISEQEIMNFGAYHLSLCVMSDLTRYAIGWVDQPPRLKRLRVAVRPVGLKGKKGARG